MFQCALQGAVSVITTKSPLVTDNLANLSDVMESATRAGQPMVVFDLSEVPLANGHALEYLLDTRDQFLACGGNLKLAAPSSLLRDILRITQVLDQFEVYDQVSEAVGSYVR